MGHAGLSCSSDGFDFTIPFMVALVEGFSCFFFSEQAGLCGHTMNEMCIQQVREVTAKV